VVHTLRLVLASGAGRTDSISCRLGSIVAFSYYRGRRSRRFSAGVGGGHASRKIIECAVSNLKSRMNDEVHRVRDTEIRSEHCECYE